MIKTQMGKKIEIMTKKLTAEIDRRLEILSKLDTKGNKDASLDRIDRVRKLEKMLIKMGDKGGRCPFCLRKIKGKPHKIRVREWENAELTREERVYYICKRCYDSFREWFNRDDKNKKRRRQMVVGEYRNF